MNSLALMADWVEKGVARVVVLKSKIIDKKWWWMEEIVDGFFDIMVDWAKKGVALVVVWESENVEEKWWWMSIKLKTLGQK